MASMDTDIDLTDGGRTLRFRIRPMGARKQERWLARLALVLARAGRAMPAGTPALHLPAHLFTAGGLASLSDVPFDRLEPLLDEMWENVFRVLDSGVAVQLKPETIDGVVTDVRTLLALRREVLRLNFGHLLDALPVGEAS
ncbi:hypothetical protein IHV25_07230 [Phaeovibrio sulfidiphilus]|uniref:Uncharacterized protein n=1 Tax=Phaeovibrio sulfidiphilus TaxID=1220600 RepID=A0A8J6YVZ3_9PROT|nr:hypothetical protein [Phaeovibrio sulfidiphilus]MBE1237439.1 hypothetical protein [Phaeovibrio sulfidiphilus]